MKFPAAIAAMERDGSINAGILHYLAFKQNAHYLWMGSGPLTTADGNVWDGIGDIVTIEGGGQQAGFVASNLTLTLAAGADIITDDLVQAAINSESVVYGRRYVMYLQFFDADWQPVDGYKAIYSGVMDRMTFRHSADLRELTLNIESPFVRRRAPRLETFSYTAQRSKYPDDLGLEFISGLKNKTVKWPDY